MNVLFVCPYTPTPIRTRPYNLILALARQGHTVTLATVFENDAERQALQKFTHAGIHVIAEPLSKINAAWNMLGVAASRQPLQSMYSWRASLVRQIVAQKLDIAPAVIHVEHLRGSQYALALKSLGVPVVWDSVDCISFLFEQAKQASRNPFSRLITRLELPRTRRYEAFLTNQFTHVLVTSEKDCQALTLLRARFAKGNGRLPKIHVLQNGVDLNYFCPADAPRAKETLVLTGKMSYHANVTAALYLINEIMPRVWKVKPNVHVQIVGQRPPRQLIDWGRQANGRVQVTGTVPDVRPYLAQATLAVVPILYGAGIQNKVLEAMAMRTPVVATSKAVSALAVENEEHVLLGNTADEFANQIIRVLDDASLGEHIANHGYRFVHSNHDWNLIAHQLEKIYHSAIADGNVA